MFLTKKKYKGFLKNRGYLRIEFDFLDFEFWFGFGQREFGFGFGWKKEGFGFYSYANTRARLNIRVFQQMQFLEAFQRANNF